MDERLATLLDYGADLQAQHDYPATPLRLAQALNIRLIASDEDSANVGPPAHITYNARYGLSRRRFTLWHEIAHIIMGWHGIDRDFDEWIGEGDGNLWREQVANLLAGQLMVPRIVVRSALSRYGVTPAAILEMQDVTGMSEAVCLRRLIFDDLRASRAAAVLVGSRVTDVSSHNYRLPIYRFATVPDPGFTLQGALLHPVRKNRVMALWEE